MYKKLVTLADQLDSKGLHAEASTIDAILQEAYFLASDSAGGVPVEVQEDGSFVKVKDKDEFEPLPWEAREEEIQNQLAKQPLAKLKDLFEAIKNTVLGGVELQNKKFTFSSGHELMDYKQQLDFITKLIEAPEIDTKKVIEALIGVPKHIVQFILELIKKVALRKLKENPTPPATPVSATPPTTSVASTSTKGLSVKADPTDNQPIRVDVMPNGLGGIVLAGEGEPTPVYLMVAKMIPPGNQLFINPNIKTPNAATNDNLKAYFDFKDTRSSTYELVKPAQMKWDGKQGTVESKGLINY